MIDEGETVPRYERLWQAVCKVESDCNPLAYHIEADGWPAVGIAQIRYQRLRDYNRRTHHNYEMKDLYDPAVSRKIFNFYFNQFSDMDLAIRRWNGDGKVTFKYLKLVKSELR
jgi:hypothetical protein